MSSTSPSPHSTRLENLSLGPQGAAFDLDGRTVRLGSDGYAASVAAIQEFYRQALADYYERSAEISRERALARPSILGRLFSWLGRFLGRGYPDAAAPHGAPARPPLIVSSPRADAAAPARHPPEPSHSRARASLAPWASSPIVDSHAHTPAPNAPAITPQEAGNSQMPASAERSSGPPILHMVFADRDGVHVIWQLASTNHGPLQSSRDRVESKTPVPRLELTYGLDSSMADRLQACYGQLAQLGYEIAGLDAVRAAPEKSAASKKVPKPAPDALPVKATQPNVERSPAEASRAPEPRSSPRKPRHEAVPARPEPDKPIDESPNRDPSLLPGL